MARFPGQVPEADRFGEVGIGEVGIGEVGIGEVGIGEVGIGEVRIGELMSAVELPLENVEFALEQYLLAHGQRLDGETRALLAGVRDCVGRVVVSTRRLSRQDNEASAGESIDRAA